MTRDEKLDWIDAHKDDYVLGQVVEIYYWGYQQSRVVKVLGVYCGCDSRSYEPAAHAFLVNNETIVLTGYASTSAADCLQWRRKQLRSMFNDNEKRNAEYSAELVRLATMEV